MTPLTICLFLEKMITDLEKVSSLLIGSLSVAVSESAKNKPPGTRVWGARGLRILHPQVPRGAVVALKTFVGDQTRRFGLVHVLIHYPGYDTGNVPQ